MSHASVSMLVRLAGIGLLAMLLLDVLRLLPAVPAVGWAGLTLVAVLVIAPLMRR